MREEEEGARESQASVLVCTHMCEWVCLLTLGYKRLTGDSRRAASLSRLSAAAVAMLVRGSRVSRCTRGSCALASRFTS